MMLDANVVAVSPTSTWRVLNAAGLLRRWNTKRSKKGTGFVAPDRPHRHWHVDVSYINISGTFYYLLSVLDGYSRSIVHWELRESMTEADVEVVLQRARELHPEAKPRVISDNGPQFIAKDFKEFIRVTGMTHVRTAPYYPQSNGKIERWHQSLKRECIRPGTPLSPENARELVSSYVEHYNTVRLHSAIGYVTPRDKLEGKEEDIFRERDRKLESAREVRRRRRAAARKSQESATETASGERHHQPRRIDDEDLRHLRNDVQILTVISSLNIPTKNRGARVRFRCPCCHSFSTATNPETNLARCFRCERNFNPIDLVAAELDRSFLEAVRYLDGLLCVRS